MQTSKEIVLHEDYPFREDILRAQRSGTGKYIREQVLPDGSSTKVTVTIEKIYNRLPFAMLYKHKEMLDDLEPASCKILIHMAVTMNYGAQQVLIKYKATRLSRRAFNRAMLELVTHNVIRKVAGKKELYWVNLTILILGVTKQLEQGK